MIARLSGTVADVQGDQLVLDVQGVGYAVGVPLRTAESVAEGDALALWVHTAVREDAITLYGFASRQEKLAFELLISVSQVGPRLGLNALSRFTAAGLAAAVEGNDLKALSSISGVGKKTAERIVLELRGKMALAPGAAPVPVTAPARVAEDGFALALAQLGYKRAEIELAAERLKADGLDAAPLGERITAALRVLTGGAARPSGERA